MALRSGGMSQSVGHLERHRSSHSSHICRKGVHGREVRGGDRSGTPALSTGVGDFGTCLVGPKRSLAGARRSPDSDDRCSRVHDRGRSPAGSRLAKRRAPEASRALRPRHERVHGQGHRGSQPEGRRRQDDDQHQPRRVSRRREAAGAAGRPRSARQLDDGQRRGQDLARAVELRRPDGGVYARRDFDLRRAQQLHPRPRAMGISRARRWGCSTRSGASCACAVRSKRCASTTPTSSSTVRRR